MPNCLCGGARQESYCYFSNSKIKEPVIINVYDMHWANDYTKIIGFGIYHTGIEIYGIEYAYAGHPYPFSGIFEMRPRDIEKLGERYHFRQSIQLGYTNKNFREIDRIMFDLGILSFTGDKYHLIRNNCNHFTGAACKLVCGKCVPRWFNRAAKFCSYLPYIDKLVPKYWLTPTSINEDFISRVSGQSTSYGVSNY